MIRLQSARHMYMLVLAAAPPQSLAAEPHSGRLLPSRLVNEAIDASTPGLLMPVNFSVVHLADNRQMLEVFRQPSKCLGLFEGLGGGGWGDCGEPYKQAGGFTDEEAECNDSPKAIMVSKKKNGYGCWFWPAKGTGVFVNVGRSLRVADRCEAHKVLGIARVDNLAGDHHCDKPPGDRLYCERARRRGFDSIQIAQSHAIHTPEIIMCTGKCMTEAVFGACPPLDMQDASGAPCKCKEDLGAVNCGNSSSSYPEIALSQHLLPKNEWTDRWGCEQRRLENDHHSPQRKQVLCPSGSSFDIASLSPQYTGTINLPSWDALPAKGSLLSMLWHRGCTRGLYPSGACRRVCVSQDL